MSMDYRVLFSFCNGVFNISLDTCVVGEFMFLYKRGGQLCECVFF